jgi:flagellin-like hook-associated protein FlgL
MGINNGNIARDLEKLASGFRINQAADDAAGLAVSEKMRSMIREHIMCESNVKKGISAANTADGALNEISAMIVRAREICVGATNGTYAEEDRVVVEDELHQILGEIDRVTQSTHYNEIPLLRWPDKQEDPVEIIGHNVTWEVISSAPFDWGALELPGVPSDFAYTEDGRAKPATVTMSLDPSINFSDWQSLEGKTVTLPMASGSSTYIFSQFTGTAFTERYGSGGGTIIPIGSSASVQTTLENLTSRSAILSNVTVNPSRRSITFEANLTIGDDPLTARLAEFPMPISGIPNPYETGITYNEREVSSAGKSLFTLAGAYPHTNLPFTYGADASLSITFSIAGDSSSLTATQVENLARVNPYANPQRNSLQLSIMNTTKTITFLTGGTPGTVSGSGNTRNIDISEGMSGSTLRTALTEAFSQLDATATWSGANNATLTLSVGGLSTTSWGAITLRETTVPRTGTPATSGSPGTPDSTYPPTSAPEPSFSVTGSSSPANATDLSIAYTSTASPETGQTLHEITDWPTAQEIRDAVATAAATNSPVSFGSTLFYDGTKDYGQKDVTWNAPTVTPPKTATGGLDTGTIDLGITNGTNISSLTDDQLMNIVYGVIGVNPDANGKLYKLGTRPNITNSTGRLNFREQVTTGRTIITPGGTRPGTPAVPAQPASPDYMPATYAQITSTSAQYFTREATVARLPEEFRLPMSNGNVDIGKLAGSGFQLNIERAANNSYTGVRTFEFSTTGTNGSVNSSTGNYTINIAGCITPDDVAARVKAAVQTATGATAAADLKVTAAADGKLSISSRYRADSTFSGVYNDGYGRSGLFGAGSISGTFKGGSKDAPPETIVDFSSVDSSNAVDLLGKGFRIKCGSCESEYFNILFVENLDDVGEIENISILRNENGVEATYYNYFVELKADSLSGSSINGSAIVADIISQLTPQLDHFTAIHAGEPSSKLVISDKRYNPEKNGVDVFGSVFPGVYTDYKYEMKTDPIYADPPEGLTNRELPIYVSSVGEKYIYLHLPHLTLETLHLVGPPELDFSKTENADAWLNKIDNAAMDITSARAQFGADTNRLEAAYHTLTNAEIQVTASESSIRDLDIAKQTMELTKNQILTESAQAALTQANQLSQGILNILQAIG